MKNIFHQFERAFIEANETIFLEGEGPTLSQSGIRFVELFFLEV